MKARSLLCAGIGIAFTLCTQVACKTNAVSQGNAVATQKPASEEMMADRVVVTNVMSETQLLAILEHIERVEGVKEVRRIDFDRKTNEVLLEIVGVRRRQTYWRVALENLPKATVTLESGARRELPSWYTKPAAK